MFYAFVLAGTLYSLSYDMQLPVPEPTAEAANQSWFSMVTNQITDWRFHFLVNQGKYRVGLNTFVQNTINNSVIPRLIKVNRYFMQ